jgi:hypothetical protein
MSAPILEREFYSCPIRLDGKERYLLWFSGATDGVWMDGDAILSWLSESALRDYATKRGMDMSSEHSSLYDLDGVDAFARSRVEIGAKEKLDAWNLFVDVASSVGAAEFLAAERQQLDVYNHLFYLTDSAPVKDTRPECLTPAENDVVRHILSLGLAVLRHYLRIEETG